MRIGSSPGTCHLTIVLQLIVSHPRFLGGRYVPETLIVALNELEEAYTRISKDPEFQVRVLGARHCVPLPIGSPPPRPFHLQRELNALLKDYVGRESPLYFAERLSESYKRPDGSMPHIYLKREDLNHTGAHKINNSLGQALLCKRMGKTRIIAETGAGQHGVATATVCARFGLQCIIYMVSPRPQTPALLPITCVALQLERSCLLLALPQGAKDMERQALNVFRMRLLGAEVRAVHSGTATLKDATSEAIRDWVTNVETTHYILGSGETSAAAAGVWAAAPARGSRQPAPPPLWAQLPGLTPTR